MCKNLNYYIHGFLLFFSFDNFKVDNKNHDFYLSWLVTYLFIKSQISSICTVTIFIKLVKMFNLTNY